MTALQPSPPSRQMNLLAGMLRALLFGVVLGALASLCAIGFVDAIKWLHHALFVTAAARRTLPDAIPAVLLIVLPVVGGLIAGLLIRLIPEQRPHNPADVIEAAQCGKTISPRTGLVTIGAVVAGLGSGASVGQYGPLVHLGGSIGSSISKWCKVEPGLGIGCGVAAAISTAFSAPIAGIIFAHEVVLRHYSLRAFAPITVASTTGLFIADQVFDRPALFEMSVAKSVFAPEFLTFILIGVGGALVAVAYMQLILAAHRFSERLPVPDWIKPAVAGLGVGITAQWVPEILGIGQEILRLAIIPGVYEIADLSVILIAKITATAVCLGFGFAGGVFSPALLIGILFGAIVGQAGEVLYGDFYSGLEFYAICGLAAVTSPVIGAPLTTILIVFELTRNYELTTAVMVSVVFSNLVAYRLFGRSLFDRQLSLRGFDLSHGRDKVMLAQTGIGDYITTDFVRVAPDDDLPTVRRALLNAGRMDAHVAGDENKYLGVITLGELVAAESSDASVHTIHACNLARSDVLRFTGGMSVWDALAAMEEFVGESIPVTDAGGKLLGVVYESTLVKAYLQTVHHLRAEENAAH